MSNIATLIDLANASIGDLKLAIDNGDVLSEEQAKQVTELNSLLAQIRNLDLRNEFRRGRALQDFTHKWPMPLLP